MEGLFVKLVVADDEPAVATKDLIAIAGGLVVAVAAVDRLQVDAVVVAGAVGAGAGAVADIIVNEGIVVVVVVADVIVAVTGTVINFGKDGTTVVLVVFIVDIADVCWIVDVVIAAIPAVIIGT